MPKYSQQNLSIIFKRLSTPRWLLAAIIFSSQAAPLPSRLESPIRPSLLSTVPLGHEGCRIFSKYNIDPELLYIAGGPPSLQALIAGDVAISFTAGGATVAANLSGSDVVLSVPASTRFPSSFVRS
jgi:hypothetical protein